VRPRRRGCIVADHMALPRRAAALCRMGGAPCQLNTSTSWLSSNRHTQFGTGCTEIGDVDGAMARAITKIEATYQVPFCARHNGADDCTVHVRNDGCESGRQPGHPACTSDCREVTAAFGQGRVHTI